jgi:hypothetical protein
MAPPAPSAAVSRGVSNSGSAWQQCMAAVQHHGPAGPLGSEPSHAGAGSGADEAHSSTWVPRVHICFQSEDPFLYSKRFAEAHRARARAEALMRYTLCVDSMPTEDQPRLNNEQVGAGGCLGHFAANFDKEGCTDSIPSQVASLTRETNKRHAWPSSGCGRLWGMTVIL